MQLDLPTILKDRRKQAGYKQHQIADTFHMVRATYGAYEEGRSTPSIHFLIRLQSFYGYRSLDDFLDINKRIDNQSDKSMMYVLFHQYCLLNRYEKAMVNKLLNLNLLAKQDETG